VELGGFAGTAAVVSSGQWLAMPSPTRANDPAGIAKRILVLRGQRVLLDADLAILYGVPTKALNQAVRRNRSRFPDDFCFRISDMEKSEVVTICDHLQRLKFSPTRPLAFTEQGAFMAAAVLNSPRAVDMSVYVVRAFVKLREVLASHTELARKLAALEMSVATLDARTRRQFEEVYAAIRALMAPPAVKSRPIGFTANVDEDA
jgi:hypothetical protein